MVGNPFFFQWGAVPHASSYRIEMHTSADFEPANMIISCTTVNTTYVPTPGSPCWPGAANSYYWRVVAQDEPRNPAVVTDRIVSQVEYFHYLPDMVDLTTATPAHNASVKVPTLKWDAVPGAAKYRVFVTKINNGSGAVNGNDTTGTSFTPRSLLTVGESYRWWVQTVSGSGRLGPVVVPAAQNVFTVGAMTAATGTTPEPLSPTNGISVVRFPTLTWTPVVDANRYKIGVRPAGSIQAFTELPDTFSYPAGEDDGSTYLSLGTFEWIVNAYEGSTYLSTSMAARSFVVGNLNSVTGHSVALTGTASGNPAGRCAAVLPEICRDMKSTPVLRWNRVPNAGYYKVTLSRDAEMTSIISTTSIDDIMFIPTTSLADSQAGAAYHWFVQPCKADSKCSPLAHATNAFNKTSNGVELVSPANSLGTRIADTVTFTWKDWLVTNTSIGGADPVTGVNPRVEARQYRIQVATDEGFQNIIDAADVDQTTYTAYTKAYQEGPLYWRVFAIDGSLNVLTSSQVWRLDKESPTPVLASPIGGAVINATAPFRWRPLHYAAGYELEVNKDDDDSSASRIIFASSKLVAYTAADPLPASAKAYLWRVRAVNASGGKGDWSAWGRFFVKVTAPELTSPAASAFVPANDAMFSWKTVIGAASSSSNAVSSAARRWPSRSRLWRWHGPQRALSPTASTSGGSRGTTVACS